MLESDLPAALGWSLAILAALAAGFILGWRRRSGRSAGRGRSRPQVRDLGPILEHAADAVLLLDGERRILAWNRAAEEIFAVAPGEMQGMPYARLVPGGQEEAELLAPLPPGEKVKDLRTRRRRGDGAILDVSLTRSRLPEATGTEERFVEILRDISATRRLEEDLLRSEKMAAVGKISSKVVHEIRNPLASINLNVDLLLQGPGAGGEDPEAREILQVIKREVRRLSQITEEYLQFSRLPRAAFRGERVNDILIELSDFARPLISRKGVRLTLLLDEADPEAVCDATLLRQALLNLLRNSVDATVEGEGAIQMATRLRPQAEGGSTVEISVEDNGCGIPRDLLERIYEPFFTTKKDGTGLGLALVQRAVEEHRGSIRCESLPGKGTIFRLVIPCAPPPARSPQTAPTV
jgi:PAS domain S-box-containing protein